MKDNIKIQTNKLLFGNLSWDGVEKTFGSPMPGRQFNAGSPYKYGFNGMLKDDEVKGEGNSLDFGARIYDSRLGRFLSIDKRTSEYAPISPYTFALNCPNILKDGDGNVVVDGNGNEVTISLSIGEDGKVSANFSFVIGTSEEVIRDFMNNGGKIINAMVKTETGAEQVLKAIITSDNIHFSLSSKEVVREKVDKYGNVSLGILYGKTTAHPIIETDEDGKPIGLDLNAIEKGRVQMEVEIFEGSIDASEKKGDEGKFTDVELDFRQVNANKNQKIASVAGHETEHATNPADRIYIISGKEMRTNGPEHKAAIDKGKQILNETKND